MVVPRSSLARRPETWAPAVFVVLWSTGFVVAHYATQDAGPLTFLMARMIVTSAVLAVVAGMARAPRPDRSTALATGVAALGLHVAYLGGLFVAIDRGLPSGLSALIAGLHPVVTAFGARVLLGERLAARQWGGIVLGICGVGVVVGLKLSDGTGAFPRSTLIGMAIAVAGMAGGTLYQRRRASGMPLLWGTTVQYVMAAACFTVAAGVGEHFELHLTTRFVLSLLWAVGVLSVAAVLLMMWLLARLPAARVSSLFFLTPALSTIEGAVLFGERLSWVAVVGLAVALAGVAMVVRSPSR